MPQKLEESWTPTLQFLTGWSPSVEAQPSIGLHLRLNWIVKTLFPSRRRLPPFPAGEAGSDGLDHLGDIVHVDGERVVAERQIDIER